MGTLSKALGLSGGYLAASRQVIDLLIAGMAQNEFYILCPDNEVTREVDHRRILWAADDIAQNRPALSRWHSDYKDAFEKFLHAKE